jgi:hypothetical protein
MHYAIWAHFGSDWITPPTRSIGRGDYVRIDHDGSNRGQDRYQISEIGRDPDITAAPRKFLFDVL